MDFYNHYELMTHEMPNAALSIIKRGYRIDGSSGIKIACNLNTLNSADYLEADNKKYNLIEFTDLIAHYKRASNDAKILCNEVDIEKTNPDWRVQKKILAQQCENIKNQVHRELVEKFIKTWTIIQVAKLKLANPPLAINQETPKAIVVIAPEDPNSTQLEGIELARFMSKIHDVLTRNLPEDLYAGHIVCDIHTFCHPRHL